LLGPVFELLFGSCIAFFVVEFPERADMQQRPEDELKQRMAALGLDFEDEEEPEEETPKKKWFGKSDGGGDVFPNGGTNARAALAPALETRSSPRLSKRADDLGIGIDIPMADMGAAREEEDRRKEEQERQQKQEEWRRRQAAEAASSSSGESAAMPLHASLGDSTRQPRTAAALPAPASAEKERVPVLQVSVNGVEGGADLYKSE
jgi:hypothetical protein